MHGSSNQISNGNLTDESRDSRFAELDARIKAGEATRHQKQAAKPKRVHRPGPRLPAAVRKEIARFARELRREHRKLFPADPKLKDRASRFLRSLLPPKRKRGRPGIDSVTKAIQLRQRFKRLYPGEKPEQIWKRVYPQAVYGYANMSEADQQDARAQLRERVSWRQRDWRRCRRGTTV